MTPLEQIKGWLSTYPGYDILGNLNVDYTDKSPCSSISPGGMVEISRSENLVGDVTVTNQINFALYVVLDKAPGDNEGATINADWVMDFQRWVQEQSIRHRAPVFGNIDTDSEVITAQNGALYEANKEGCGIYFVQLSATYKLFYEE
ncbi:MAG: hypothetical protein RSF82_11915 [Angelakisella sp.]